jgi:hypothetical protein
MFFLNLVWLAACTFIIYYLGIEKDKSFDKVVFILTGAFLVYMIVPLRFRKLVLLFLAILIEIFLFGIKVGSGVTLFMIYFTSITYIKQKPFRYIMIFVSLAFCIMITSGFILMPLVRLIVMSGAVFLMLRYIYLIYELNYLKVPPVFIDRLCYLFLIPNASFPLFPALSPLEFLKTYYDSPAETSLKRGCHWITTGIIHLLIYRIIYLYFTPSPYDIDNFSEWLWFILSAYSLIFRLSGLFYIAAGFVQVFGFRLPPIFDHVLFASSFPDLWRRVNLYWRAFIMRVFYYPLVFKFRKSPQGPVILLAVMTMFILTWLLHAWQWYWIKGTYYFYAPDMLFWLLLGVIISIHSYRSYLRSNKPKVHIKKENYFIAAAKVVLMFVTMSFLWSLWTASSLTEFIYFSKFSKLITTKEFLSLGILIAAVIIISGFIRKQYFTKNWFAFVFDEIKPQRGLIICLAVILLCEGLKMKDPAAVEDFLALRMNKKDQQTMERGYYDQVLSNDDKAVEFLNTGTKKWNLDRDAYVKTNNELVKEFKTSYSTTFKGGKLSTNGLGLRDKELTMQRPDSRWIFVGGSYVMGSGVSNGETFADLMEERLKQVEILNFGVGGYFLIQNVFVIDHKITKDLEPNFIFLFIHSEYRYRSLDNFAKLIQKGTPLTYPFLKEIVAKAGIKKGMCHLEIYNRLKPYLNELFEWGFDRIALRCKEENAVPILVYLPVSVVKENDPDKDYCMSLAERKGFMTIDISNVFNGRKAEDIQIAWWDTHPNVKGHRILADSLIQNLKRNEHFSKLVQ